MHSEYQFGVAVLVVGLLEWLKRSQWFGLLTVDSAKVNRIVSALLATATAAGFHFAMTGSLWQGGAVHIQFPPLVDWLKLLPESAGQFGMQTIVYQLSHGALTAPKVQP